MMLFKKSTIVVGCLCVFAMVATTRGADVTLTTTMDAAVRTAEGGASQADITLGGSSFIKTFWDWANYATLGEGHGDVGKGYWKFSLPAGNAVATAQLNLLANAVTGTNWFVMYDVYGLKDNAAGNNWTDAEYRDPVTEELIPYTGPSSGGITWNNAPANQVVPYSLATLDQTYLGLDASMVTYLGRMEEPAASGQYAHFSTPELASWLNSDTDGVVSLIVVRRVESGYTQFSAKPMWGTIEGGAPATLDLTYVPEPVTIAVLGLGALMMRRRS
jgi:hypothetical protein